MYCFTCKKITGNGKEQSAIAKNGRNMVKAVCSECGRMKTKFVGGSKSSVSKKQVGGSLLNKALNSNKIPEMHLRGFSGKYSYAGPFTKLDKRLGKDGEPLPHSMPINEVDKSALNHDRCYLMYTSTKDRNNICDKLMIEDMNDIIKDKKKGWREKADARIVKGAISTKKFFGLGKQIKKKI